MDIRPGLPVGRLGDQEDISDQDYFWFTDICLVLKGLAEDRGFSCPLSLRISCEQVFTGVTDNLIWPNK